MPSGLISLFLSIIYQMYADIIKAIDKGQRLYEGERGIFVVDTHMKDEFHADISVAHQKDDRLPYWRYFIELKIPKNKLNTAENCGQILDYLNSVHGRQVYRSEFVVILSNFESSWVFIVTYDRQNNVTIVGLGLSILSSPYRITTSCSRFLNRNHPWPTLLHALRCCFGDSIHD
jgi:hypothetical protein